MKKVYFCVGVAPKWCFKLLSIGDAFRAVLTYLDPIIKATKSRVMQVLGHITYDIDHLRVFVCVQIDISAKQLINAKNKQTN